MLDFMVGRRNAGLLSPSECWILWLAGGILSLVLPNQLYEEHVLEFALIF